MKKHNLLILSIMMAFMVSINAQDYAEGWETNDSTMVAAGLYDPIIVDGEVDSQWDLVEWEACHFINKVDTSDGSESDFDIQFKMAYYKNYIYFLADWRDDTTDVDMSKVLAEDVRRDGTVLFFDMEPGSGTEPYPNDPTIAFAAVAAHDDVGIHFGRYLNHWNVPLNWGFDQPPMIGEAKAQSSGSTNYYIEARFDVTKFTRDTLAVGDTIGFNVQCNDNDNVDVWEEEETMNLNQYYWKRATGNEWDNPNGLLGSVIMGNTLEEPVNIAQVNMNKNLQLYPNPVSDKINISLNGNPVNQVRIYNMLGIEVINKQINGINTATIDVYNLSTGVYFVKVNNGDLIKFIKE